MKKIIAVILVFCIGVGLSACKITKKIPSSNVSEISSELQEPTVPETENVEEYFSAFERMLNASFNAWDNEAADFSKLSAEELIGKYIITRDAGGGIVSHFCDCDVSDLRYECGNYSDVVLDYIDYADPKEKFDISYSFDAELIDWILVNVFGKPTDRKAETESFYFHGSKLYANGEKEIGQKSAYIIVNYTHIGNNKYELLVGCSPDDGGAEGVIESYYRFIASPKDDEQKEKYWQLYSYVRLDEDDVEPEYNQSGWQNAYITFINENSSLFRSSYLYLINVDNDEIPEMHIETVYKEGEMYEYMCSYQNGQLVVEIFKSGKLLYLKNKGAFISVERGYNGHFTLYYLKNNKFTVKESGNEFTEEDKYIWNGATVSKSIYEEKIKRCTSDPNLISVDDFEAGYFVESIVDEIKKY